jgi:hypothetical protein
VVLVLVLLLWLLLVVVKCIDINIIGDAAGVDDAISLLIQA